MVMRDMTFSVWAILNDGAGSQRKTPIEYSPIAHWRLNLVFGFHYLDTVLLVKVNRPACMGPSLNPKSQ